MCDASCDGCEYGGVSGYDTKPSTKCLACSDPNAALNTSRQNICECEKYFY